MTVLPHGTWPSPIAPADLTTSSARVDEVRLDGPDTYWLESRPQEKGRTAIVRHDGTSRADVLPEPWNCRSRVHEYGGGSYAVRDRLVVFSEFADNRVHRLDPGATDPVAITPEGQLRFGGLVLLGDHVYAVREDHRGEGEPVNELVRLDLHGDNADGGVVLATGTDFVSRPALSPDGKHIAWIAWDHPNMPWDSTRLLTADLTPEGSTNERCVAGGEGISVSQPQFAPDGTLWFVSDESGWWNLHRLEGDTAVHALPIEADMAGAQWTLGMVDYALLADGRVLTRRWVDELVRLALLDPRTGELTDLVEEGVFFDNLVTTGDEIAFTRSLADRDAEVVRGPVDGERSLVAAASPDRPDPAFVSRAEAVEWTNGAGLDSHGLFYPPVNPDAQAPDGELPPLLVFVHGGPTSRTEAAYRVLVQFWTTRGFAILDVNHTGSTGYGRDYRKRLNGQWGVVDIDDCVSGARALADRGLVDGRRLAIRGGSAGGYTTLRALTSSDAFTAGTSYYGISDLRSLLAEDHKFESRYTITMVAPFPEGEDVYLERSPLFHIEDLHGELLLFQGADDLVVVASQAQRMADAMREAGKDVELVIYEGEGHGFRRAETIIDSLERELAHYQRAFGLA